MLKENVLGGLSLLPLIFRIAWAKNPRDPRDVAPLKWHCIAINAFQTLKTKSNGPVLLPNTIVLSSVATDGSGWKWIET